MPIFGDSGVSCSREQCLHCTLGTVPSCWQKSAWDNINDNKFNEGSLEFHNDRFVDNYNYESSLLDLVL